MPQKINKSTISGNEINDEIENINHRLTTIELEKRALINKREALLKKSPNQQIVTTELSVNQKVALFQKLFKGRSDLFANRWENAKGRSGYSVACDNEWIKGVCNKPKIKCNECPNRKYSPLNNQIIYDHLSGKQVIGLYPLLTDNTCHLLVADFDKNDWQTAVVAMAKACMKFNVPHAIEISCSGKGAHLWVFFSDSVPAKDARLLGFGLLDKAMEVHPDLSFESYDRLFPNQDLMPAGGFGNLIALPLQYQARKRGNSQFIDMNLKPYHDQWGFLSQVKDLSPTQLDSLLTQLRPSSSSSKDSKITDNRPPWEQGLISKSIQIESCPEQVTVILANYLYIKTSELPPTLIARLKRLASFSNPVFFKTQALRFSTHGIPRYISCARLEQGYLFLPRGCFDEVIGLLEAQDIAIDIDDKRQVGNKLQKLTFLGTLREDQKKAVNAMTRHSTGVLHAPTAFGKTVAAIGIIAKRKTNTLILTHSLQLLEQWQERLKSFLHDIDIGSIGGGKRKPTGQIDIATYQSLINKKDNSIDPIIQQYGQVIIDECHHISAPRYEMLLNEVHSKYVLGLTATPDRQDGHQKIIFMLAGPIRHKVKSTHVEKFEQQVIVTKLYSTPTENLINTEQRPRITDVYRWLTEDQNRTQRIVTDIMTKISEGKHPLVLTERREHAEQINNLLIENNIQTVILRGAMRAKERKAANKQLSEAQVIVATGKYVGEGFDLPKLDTLFLALPIAWKGSLAQYAGRIHRESEGKDLVTIYDYVDSSIPMLERMFNKREKGYKAMGYQMAYADRSVE
jgi:superfamily II DNA or RNA helicase